MQIKNGFLMMVWLLPFAVGAQNKLVKKVVADQASKIALEKVNVYNEKDNSLTNQEGVFSFISNEDEINFSLIGYKDKKVSFERVKNVDTIFLESNSITLDEVIIGQEVAIIKKAYSRMKDNYALEPYNENFFLRCTLKRNDEISRLQDIYGKVSRKAIFKTKKQPDNKCAVEVLNMRKVGITEKIDFIYFQFQSFEKLFDLNALIYLNLEDFEFAQEKNVAGDYFKINFVKKEANVVKQKTSGYFIINKADYAIVETYFDFYDDVDQIPFQKEGKVEYRTTSFKRTSNYKKSSSKDKYFLSHANAAVKVEVLGNESAAKASYDYVTNYFVTNSFIAEKADSNLSMGRDIFKVKFPYAAQFWASQNQLPLTSELTAFLSRVTQNKDKKEEFEVIGNF